MPYSKYKTKKEYVFKILQLKKQQHKNKKACYLSN